MENQSAAQQRDSAPLWQADVIDVLILTAVLLAVMLAVLL